MHTPRHLFPGQQDSEQILLVTRKHWILLVKELLVLVFLGIVLQLLPSNPALNLIRTVLFMLLILAIFTIIVLYYLTVQIITNLRLVDISQTNLLDHTTSELRFDRVQDVTAEIRGVFGTIFDYGTVYVQTAGEVERFEFENIPNPHMVTKIILAQTDRFGKSAGPGRTGV